MDEQRTVSSGVEDLIARLRDDGVKAGREKAEQVLQEAREEAARILAEAKAEANEILGRAKVQIERDRNACMGSLKTAIRDTELKMESELKVDFAAHVRRLVSIEMGDREFIKQCILAVSGMATGDMVCEGQPVEVLLPKDLFETDESGSRLTPEGKERMRHLVLGISADMLRDGVELRPSRNLKRGIRVRLVGEDLEIDLSDKAISDLLLESLLPRYQAIVRGEE
jgi:V/A-type H+/Na+-transporting ATPase subunit E